MPQLQDDTDGHDAEELKADKMFTRADALREQFNKQNLDQMLKEDRKNFYGSVKDQNLKCFHGDISRSQADEILLSKAGKGEAGYGTFLIRTSKKLPKHIILSVVRQDRICHFPIGFNSNGTFKVADEIMPNFEDVYKYCKMHGKDMFKTELTQPVIKDFLPPHMWKSGKTTVLHKIVESGTEQMLDLVVAHPLSLPLGVKNEEGNTPLHIAAYMGRDGMLRSLLKYGASHELINVYGWNSLHMAAIGNNPSTVRTLYEITKCDLSAKNPLNMLTALHCAAACDNSESIQMLLLLGADATQQCNNGKTPLDVAECYKSLESIKVLSANKGTAADEKFLTKKEDWYIPDITKQEQLETEGKLPMEDGNFFVRPSMSRPQSYTIVFAWKGKWVHILVEKTNAGYSLMDGQQPYKTLEHAVDAFYRNYKHILQPVQLPQSNELNIANLATGLRFRNKSKAINRFDVLRSKTPTSPGTDNDPKPNPIFRKKPQTPVVSSEYVDVLNFPFKLGRGNSQSTSSSSERVRSQSATLGNDFSNHQKQSSIGNALMGLISPRDAPNKNPMAFPDIKGLFISSIFTLRSKARHIPTISASQIKTGNLLGEGNYGRVFDGYFVDNHQMTHPVAIKILKQVFNGEQRAEFLDEATVMRRLSHPFIVRLFGVVTNPNDLWMIQELLPLGSLHSYLRNNPNVDFTKQAQLWTVQLADGMGYMESKHYVHRDLAARNLLLASLDQIKISDFGLSRRIRPNSLYVQHSLKPIPIAWYAPEAIFYYVFTNKSDVWSFGVTVWEMYTHCDHPYKEINGDPFIIPQYLMAGNRLVKPESCSMDTWNLIYGCWNAYPELRPSFRDISNTLELNPEYAEAVAAVKRVSLASSSSH